MRLANGRASGVYFLRVFSVYLILIQNGPGIPDSGEYLGVKIETVRMNVIW